MMLVDKLLKLTVDDIENHEKYTLVKLEDSRARNVLPGHLRVKFLAQVIILVKRNTKKSEELSSISAQAINYFQSNSIVFIFFCTCFFFSN